MMQINETKFLELIKRLKPTELSVLLVVASKKHGMSTSNIMSESSLSHATVKLCLKKLCNRGDFVKTMINKTNYYKISNSISDDTINYI